MTISKDCALVHRRSIYGELRSWGWEFNSKFRRSITISTKQGRFTVYTGRKEPIGRSLYCSKEYEYEFMSKALCLLRKQGNSPPKGQGTILDVGANNGVISISLLHTGEMSSAIAIEPEPRNFKLLKHNVNQNSLKEKFILLPYAVADQDGECVFELCDYNCGDHRMRGNLPDNTRAELFRESDRRTIIIKQERIDDLLARLPAKCLRDVSLMWIDIQGYEGKAFLGAKNLLSRKIPVAAEIWPYGIERSGMTRQQFCAIARNIWTHFWILRKGAFVQRTIDELERLYDRLGSQGHFTNVIFTYQ